MLALIELVYDPLCVSPSTHVLLLHIYCPSFLLFFLFTVNHNKCHLFYGGVWSFSNILLNTFVEDILIYRR
jgi:hypothetical protein